MLYWVKLKAYQSVSFVHTAQLPIHDTPRWANLLISSLHILPADFCPWFAAAFLNNRIIDGCQKGGGSFGIHMPVEDSEEHSTFLTNWKVFPCIRSWSPSACILGKNDLMLLKGTLYKGRWWCYWEVCSRAIQVWHPLQAVLLWLWASRVFSPGTWGLPTFYIKPLQCSFGNNKLP